MGLQTSDIVLLLSSAALLWQSVQTEIILSCNVDHKNYTQQWFVRTLKTPSPETTLLAEIVLQYEAEKY